MIKYNVVCNYIVVLIIFKFILYFYSKVITDEEYSILDEWFKSLTSSSALKVDLIVYLRTLPETVFERIRKRNRVGESEISLVRLI